MSGYYTPTGNPINGQPGDATVIAAEFDDIGDAFDKLPSLPGTANAAVVMNGAGTALTATAGTLAIAGGIAQTGAYVVTLAASATVTLTLPAVSGTLATLAGTETLTNKTLTSPTLVTPALGTPASGVLTNCTGTATGLSVGSAATLTTPRAIYGNNFDGSAALTQVIASTYGGTGNGFTKFTGPTTAERTFTLPDASATILTAASSSTVSVGYPVTSYNGGTVSSGTFTATATNAGLQYYTNNGAHTLAAPSSDCTILILITNGASAGTITFSGFTVSSSTGDTLTTVNAARFVISIVRVNSISTYLIKAIT